MWKTLRSYFHILLYFVTKALHNYCHLLGETKIYCGKYQSFLRVPGTAKTRGNPVGPTAEHTQGVKKPPTERATPSLPVQTELNWLLLFPFPIWIWLGPMFGFFIATLNFTLKFSSITNMTSRNIYWREEFHSHCRHERTEALSPINGGVSPRNHYILLGLYVATPISPTLAVRIIW